MGNTKIDINYIKDYLIKIGSKATLLSTKYKTNADKLLFKCSCGKIFDFYLSNFNICIDVDGEQHFRPTNIRGMSDKKAYETYARTSYNDEVKDKYCRDSNIQLIRISYIQVKNGKYKNIIQSIINNKNQ